MTYLSPLSKLLSFFVSDSDSTSSSSGSSTDQKTSLISIIISPSTEKTATPSFRDTPSPAKSSEDYLKLLEGVKLSGINVEDFEFSNYLRKLTNPSHAKAHGNPFLKAIKQGTLTKDAYAQYLTDLLVLYSALEKRLPELAIMPQYAPFADPKLFRAEALKQDLQMLNVTVTPSEAATKCQAHIEGLLTPIHLIGLYYTRYFGDLSGGQIFFINQLKKLELPINFFTFTEIPSPEKYKEAMRAVIDRAPLSKEDKIIIGSEALYGFLITGDFMDAAVAHMLPQPDA